MRHSPIDHNLFIQNRLQLASLLPKDSVAIVHAADILPTTGDGTLKIHPSGDLFWLTGIEQEESVLVMAPQAVEPSHREMLFIRQPNEQLALWEGEKLSKKKAEDISGIKNIRWVSELPSILHLLLCESNKVFLNANEHARASIDVSPRDLRMARQMIADYPLHDYQRLAPFLRKLRAIKSPTEVDLIRQAIDVTDAGLRKMLASLRPGIMEYELEAEVAAEFIRNRSTFGYEPIIASGAHACVLHYIENSAECRDGDLLLVDVGACYANYNADITRTYPVSGKFSDRQRSVYNSVLKVLKSSIARATVGTTQRDWKRAAQLEMNDELAALGLLTDDEIANDSDQTPACRNYFMHGLGHSLGLGVHDLAPADGPFEAGWVITVEPGIYIPDESIGVRLENDILITERGPIDLSSDIPIEVDDIESMLADSS